MKGRSRMESELGGHGTYVFSIGNALLDVNEAARSQDAYEYHRAVKQFLFLTACETGYMTTDWMAWEAANLKAKSRELTRDERGIQFAHAVGILRKKGILGKLSHEIADASEWLNEVMEDAAEDDETEELRPTP